MRHNSDRLITVSKTKLINKIKENKVKHTAEYEKAVVAYREEAKKQLQKLTKKLKNGEFGLRLALVEPIDNSTEYDKILSMFEWELAENVDLSQSEFNQYILDELPFAITSRMSNMAYLG